MIIFVYLALLAVYGLSGFTAPPKISESIESVPISAGNCSTSIPIDVRLVDLQESTYIFELMCTYTRQTQSNTNTSIPVTIEKRLSYIKNFEQIKISNKIVSKETFIFLEGTTQSEPVCIQPINVDGFDSVSVALTMTLTDPEIESFVFRYRYLDQAYPTFIHITRYIMSSFILYGLVVFLVGNIWSSKISLLSVLLGITGVLASHPLEFLLPASLNRLTGTILLYAFVNYFRVFLLIMLTCACKATGNVSEVMEFLSLIGGALMVGIDVYSVDSDSTSGFHKLRLVSTLIYMGIACVLIGTCIVKSMKIKEVSMRLVALIILTLVTTVASLFKSADFSQFHALPDMLLDASHFLGAAVCLILLKPVATEDIDVYTTNPRVFLLR